MSRESECKHPFRYDDPEGCAHQFSRHMLFDLPTLSSLLPREHLRWCVLRTKWDGEALEIVRVDYGEEFNKPVTAAVLGLQKRADHLRRGNGDLRECAKTLALFLSNALAIRGADLMRCHADESLSRHIAAQVLLRAQQIEAGGAMSTALSALQRDLDPIVCFRTAA